MQQLTKEQAETLKYAIEAAYGTSYPKSALAVIDEYTECTEDEEETFLLDGHTVQDIRKLQDLLISGISWSLTPQGYSFWNNVEDEVQVLIDKLEELDPDEIFGDNSESDDNGCTDSDCYCHD